MPSYTLGSATNCDILRLFLAKAELAAHPQLHGWLKNFHRLTAWPFCWPAMMLRRPRGSTFRHNPHSVTQATHVPARLSVRCLVSDCIWPSTPPLLCYRRTLCHSRSRPRHSCNNPQTPLSRQAKSARCKIEGEKRIGATKLSLPVHDSFPSSRWSS